jgi:hypothetical protein
VPIARVDLAERGSNPLSACGGDRVGWRSGADPNRYGLFSHRASIAGASRKLSDLSAEFTGCAARHGFAEEAALMPQQPPPRKPLKRAYRSVLSRLR